MKRDAEDYGFDDLTPRLLELVPEITQHYEEELKFFGPEAFGQHIVFSDVFNPYLVDLLRSEGDHDQLSRSFDLIEEMTTSPDKNVVDVVNVTIYPTLISESLLGRAWKYMGEKTRELTRQRVTDYPLIEDQAKFDKTRYMEAWEQAIEALGGIENLTIDALLSIRSRLYPQFGIKVYPRA